MKTDLSQELSAEATGVESQGLHLQRNWQNKHYLISVKDPEEAGDRGRTASKVLAGERSHRGHSGSPKQN